MSAIGERIAVLSLGLSCQTSRQIDGHVPLLQQLTGDETLKEVSLPFDWLISTPAGLTGMLADGIFFPESHEDLYADQGRLRLKAHDILYWHVSRLISKPGHPGFEDAKSKFRHTSGKLAKLATIDRVVGVISDTQGNLPWVEDEWKVSLTETSPEQADEVRRGFEKYLGRSVDLLMVSRNPRPDFVSRPDFAYYHMVPKTEGWGGDGRDWAKVFRDYFSKSEQPADAPAR